MWRHPSTNYNSSHGRVVANVVNFSSYLGSNLLLPHINYIKEVRDFGGITINPPLSKVKQFQLKNPYLYEQPDLTIRLGSGAIHLFSS